MKNSSETKGVREGRAPDPAPETGDDRLDAIGRLLAIVDRLREPGGCPWDREQTVESMAPSLIEESFEMVEAIERGDEPSMVEEAGDVLMVLALLGRIASESGRFDLGDAARAVGDKLIRRHPHVFGEEQVDGSAQVLANWERIKREERIEDGEDSSALAGVPAALPALQRAQRIGAKAIAAGFRWSDVGGALAKLREEVDELGELVAGERDRERIEIELGDVLLAASFLGGYLDVDPERATRAAVRRFEARFRDMEAHLREGLEDASLEDLPLDQWIDAWEAAKERLARRSSS